MKKSSKPVVKNNPRTELLADIRNNNSNQNKRRAIALALFDFQAETADELSFRATDKLLILRQDRDERWWEAELNGKRGWVPSNFLQIIESGDSTNDRNSSSSSPTHRALYTYAPATAKELAFREGDLLVVVTAPEQRSKEAWWIAELNGTRGYVPANYLKPIAVPSKNATAKPKHKPTSKTKYPPLPPHPHLNRNNNSSNNDGNNANYNESTLQTLAQTTRIDSAIPSSPADVGPFATLARTTEIPYGKNDTADAKQSKNFATLVQTSNLSNSDAPASAPVNRTFETLVQTNNPPSPASAPNLNNAPAVPPPNAIHNSSGSSSSMIGADHLVISTSELSFEKRLGGGSFGEVFLGRYCGTKVAIKRLLLERLEEEHTKEFLAEAQVMTRLPHPRIVLLMAFTDPSKPKPCLVMQLMEGGSLFDCLYVKKSPLKSQLIALQVAEGLAFLHTRKPPIAHRDIKSPNVLLDAHGEAKLADFGLAKIKATSESTLQSKVGSPVWMAPEVIDDSPYSTQADVYSYAIVLYELLTKELPWKGKGQVQLFRAVTSGQRPPLPVNCPPQWKSLIEKCWANAPADRPTMASIIPLAEELPAA